MPRSVRGLILALELSKALRQGRPLGRGLEGGSSFGALEAFRGDYEEEAEAAEEQACGKS